MACHFFGMLAGRALVLLVVVTVDGLVSRFMLEPIGIA
jgi:hypothetical protein